MKVYLISSVLLAIVSKVRSAPMPKDGDGDAHLVDWNYEPNVEGGYNYRYETSNGIKREEFGRLKDLGGDQGQVYIIDGSYGYIGPDGIEYRVKFVADEKGFRPRGDHLPPAADVKVKSVDEEDEDDLPPPAAIPQSALTSLVG